MRKAEYSTVAIHVPQYDGSESPSVLPVDLAASISYCYYVLTLTAGARPHCIARVGWIQRLIRTLVLLPGYRHFTVALEIELLHHVSANLPMLMRCQQRVRKERSQ